MDLLEAIEARHSVRRYTDRKIEGDVLKELQHTVFECNKQSGLHIQLCIDEPAAFTGMMARYGKFTGVRNYIALVGKKGKSLEESCGYYGEKLVIKAQQLGLNTCWVAMSFSKGKSKKSIKTNPGEKLLMVISLGYGEHAGTPHKNKPLESLYIAAEPVPEWFRRGIKAAQLAPTAMNQQKFQFELDGNKVAALPGAGFYTKVDLGIAKYHFEIAAGTESWRWQ